jgi:hypothetical protein
MEAYLTLARIEQAKQPLNPNSCVIMCDCVN